MIYYVSCRAEREGRGTSEDPFKWIQSAAEIAKPGDVIKVAPGIYREYVNPQSGGTEENPIIYESQVK